MRFSIVLLLLATGCPEYGYTEIDQVDSFQQRRKNAVDLLIVVDNSCSMVEEQDNLARNFDALIDTFTVADVDWQLAVTTTDIESPVYRGLLMGGDDEIILRNASGAEIDRVEYTREWVFTAGTALSLSSDKLTSNGNLESWCPATESFSDGSYGSPGAWNPLCGGGDWVPTSGTDDGPIVPTSGKLVVTEIMAWSAGLDSQCEWVELANTTDDTLDLSLVNIADRGQNSVWIPEGTTLGPFELLVVGRSTDTSVNCGTPVDIAFEEGFTLNQDVRVIGPDTPDNGEIFGELVAQGTIGTGIEMGLEAARLVFEEPYFSESNQGFLREEANFSVLFVSDETDVSPYPSDAYVRYFTSLKGDRAYRDRSIVNLSGVIGKDLPPGPGLPSCETENGSATYGEKYLAAINETNGLVESICAPDFAPIVEKLGLTLSGLSLDFELSEWPQIETLTVELYENEDRESFVRTLEGCGVDYTYVPDGNLLHFEEEQVPPSEYWVVARYQTQTATNTATGCEE